MSSREILTWVGFGICDFVHAASPAAVVEVVKTVGAEHVLQGPRITDAPRSDTEAHVLRQ